MVLAGFYLAHRRESEQHRIHLYYLDNGGRGFFAEVGYEEALVELQVLRSFRSVVPLADFIHGVRLPEW